MGGETPVVDPGQQVVVMEEEEMGGGGEREWGVRRMVLSKEVLMSSTKISVPLKLSGTTCNTQFHSA